MLLKFRLASIQAALADMRAKVDEAKRDLPRDADEPNVREVNLSLYRCWWWRSGDLPGAPCASRQAEARSSRCRA